MINVMRPTTQIIRELRDKHRMKDLRPPPRKDDTGKPLPLPREEVIAYLRLRQEYRSELKTRLMDQFKERFKDQIAEAIKRKAALAEAAKKRKK